VKTHADGNLLICEHSARNHPEFVASRTLITSVTIQTMGNHEKLDIFNRGGFAGTLTVNKGDGEEIAGRLIG
jgi:hypothetical protein